MSTSSRDGLASLSLSRRHFLYGTAGAIVELKRPRAFANPLQPSGNISPAVRADAMNLFVSTTGDDRGPGTADHPLRTFAAAQAAVRVLRQQNPGAVTVYFREGTYYLADTALFTAEDSAQQQSPTTYSPYPGERVMLSGGTRLTLHWKPFRNGIFAAQVPAGTTTDQLFINGKRQILARYPNYDPNAKYLNGFSPDAFSPERAKRWSNPKGGYIHALHEYLWGDLHYVITGKDAQGNITYEGGWQNNRPKPMHPEYRFVENIFEELDAPGEWFLNTSKNTLFYYPPSALDLDTATVEIVRLKHLIEFRGTAASPVKWIHLRGFAFQHASRTFMETRDPLLRSDWRIYRGGALFFDGTEDCTIDDCLFDQLGGNCVFVNDYNHRASFTRCHIVEAGANGICFVGDRAAVRNPLDNYDQRLPISAIDRTPGPLTNNYPADCLVEDSLIHRTGRVEKQSAPVEISMSQRITVRHVSIYDVPRAGINIGDGCWGGHHIDLCDIFDTVKETGDHGSFNSWARDRWWGVTGANLDTILEGPDRILPVLDAVEPITLSNSRWRCDHGWDIDLDDGSSNYRIHSNLCLNGGLKLREGFFRTCENNVLVNNTLHPHVWFNDSRDIFRSNIVFRPYLPIGMRQWTQEIDFNLLHQPGDEKPSSATRLQALSLQDAHSLQADAGFLNPASGDFRVKENSPALLLGFVNFDMQSFGVQTPKLKAIARQPQIPSLAIATFVSTSETRSREVISWAGARVRNVVGLDEVSAAGTPGETGVILLQVPENSPAAKAGFLTGDVILAFNKAPIKDTHDLQHFTQALKPSEPANVTILRYQQESTLRIAVK
jgi:hypothetical protein